MLTRRYGSNCGPGTFLRGEHGDDLVPGFLLLRHGRQRPRAVIG